MLSVKDLAYEDTQLHKESVKSWCGPCPNYTRGKCRCGENGFVVKWDNSREEWRFACRGCWPADEYLPEKDRKRGFGDAISYLWHFRGMSFQTAKALMNDKEPSVREVAPSKCADYTTEVWQKKTEAAVKAAVNRRRSDDTRALEYARSRGLNDRTIDWARMGFSLYENIPRLIIPSINDGRYVAVYRRDLRPDVPKGKRWKDAFGGTKSELYLADCLVRKLVTVLVEAPICALTVLQEYGRDAINAVATGSTDGAHGAKSLARLARMPLVLVAFDADAAGDKHAEYWLKRLPKARRLRPLLKDVNDMLIDGWDIKEWIDQAIAQAKPVEETTEALPACADCGTQITAEGRDFFYVPLSEDDATCYCSHCRDQAGQLVQRTMPQQPMTEAQFLDIAQRIAAVFADGCAVHVDPPGYTIQDRARELEEPAQSSPSHDVHARTPEEYWAWVHAKVLRPPVDRYGIPYYTPEAWARKYEEEINKRPAAKLTAHLQKGA